MLGLTSFAAYLPRLRLSRATIAEAWERAGGAGELAVANYDEDTLTMAAAALDGVLAGRDAGAVTGCYFASTTPPYREKNHAAFLACVADLPRTLLTADFGGSLRCGTQALLAACQAVGADGGEIAVVASDHRRAKPGSPEELALGDAAAAVTIGVTDVIAELEAHATVAEEFMDVWRAEDEDDLHVGDAKFNVELGYGRFMKEAFEALLARAGLERHAVSTVVAYAPDARTHAAILRGLGLEKSQLLDAPAVAAYGNSGAALPLFQLTQALERARPGDRIAVLAHGSGADALLFRATDALPEAREGRAPLDGPVRALKPYRKFLAFRGHLPREPINPFTSPALLWKEQGINLPLKGQVCAECDAVQFPPRRVCWQCGVKDHFSLRKLGRQGTVVTCTKDHLIPTPEPPVCMASVDLDGGGRLYSQVTDCDPGAVQPGLRVECVFRRLHDGDGFPHYFWKFRPHG